MGNMTVYNRSQAGDEMSRD